MCRLIGHCFMCFHAKSPMEWNKETYAIICSAFPKGPKDVMRQLENKGICRMKNKSLFELLE